MAVAEEKLPLLPGNAVRKSTLKTGKGTLSELWKDKDLVVNVAIFTVVWTVTSFNFYLAKFELKYIPGSFLTNQIYLNLGASAAFISSYFIWVKLREHAVSLILAVTLVSSCPLLFVNEEKDTREVLMPLSLFAMSFGLSA